MRAKWVQSRRKPESRIERIEKSKTRSRAPERTGRTETAVREEVSAVRNEDGLRVPLALECLQEFQTIEVLTPARLVVN